MVFPEEKQIWIGEVKEEKSRILSMYSNVTKQIAEEINVAVTPLERDLLSESLPVDTEAYDAYMKGLYYLNKVNKSSIDSAMEFFNIALEKNPNWSLPYSGLTQAWAYHMQMGFVLPSQAIPKIYVNLNRALELNPYAANSHYVKGIIAVWTEWNWEKGETAFKKAIELNPNHALSRIGYAHLLLFLHREEQALEQANKGVELDPFSPFLLAMHAKVLIYTENHTAAEKYITKALEIDPDHRFAKGVLRQYYYVSGDYENWFRVWKENSNSFGKDDSISIEKTFYEQGHLAIIREKIDKIEEFESTGGKISYTGLAQAYLRIKNYEKALEYMHKAYDMHDPNLAYASTIRYDSDILKDYPRYIELMKKMRLPVK